MSENNDTQGFETVEVPTFVMNRVRENCEDFGFPTPEGFVKHAIQYLLEEEPQLSEEQRQRLLENRRQIERGETYTMEEVMDELDS
jgi:hypothetical protein